MTRLFSSLIAAAAIATALAGPATADTTFNAKFSFNPDAAVEEIYAGFERQARKACRTDVRMAGGLSNKMRYEKACRAELLDDAVAGSRNAALASLHAQSHEPENRQVLASLR